MNRHSLIKFYRDVQQPETIQSLAVAGNFPFFSFTSQLPVFQTWQCSCHVLAITVSIPWQYCCHVLPITMSAAVDLAVLLLSFTYHSVCCCRLCSIVTMFYLSQSLLLQTWQYCCHVLPITVSAAVDMAVSLRCFTYHSVCCCRPGSIVSNVTMFYQLHCMLQTWQYCQ